MELKDVDIEEIELNKKSGRSRRTRDPFEEDKENRYANDAYDVPVKKAGKGFMIFGLILFLISITILAGTYFLFKTGKLVTPAPEEAEVIPEVTYTKEEVDSMIEGAVSTARTETEETVRADYLKTLHEATSVETGTWNLLREYFPDEVVFTDGTKYTYIGVNKDLKLNTLKNESFERDPLTGYLKYINEDGTSTSHMGIDVSTFQKEVNWQQVKDSGIEFVIIRCGFRGYGSAGNLVEDSMFRQHIEGATAVGLEVGIYFFTQALTEDEAREEADFLLDIVKDYDYSGPIVIDIEPATSQWRTYGLSGDQITANVIAFCERIKEAGRTPMIYSGIKYFIRMMNYEQLEPYAKWYAYYNDPLYFPYEISIWQYSMNGTVPGIEGDVDLDIIFEKWW